MPALLLAAVVWLATGAAPAQEAPGAFQPDEHTRLLYHLDEGSGSVVHDASGRGMDAVVQGAQWAKGRVGGGMWFDGVDDSVFLAKPDALRGLKQITVECWFNQELTSGRRFLIGHDIGFHYEVDDGAAMSISLYNQGGGVPNAEGKPHQQVSLGGVSIRPGRWHHLAITYNGSTVSYFLDGVLKGRRDGPRDFSLGADCRGLWLGCYVGMDYYYSGLLDEVRVSDVVRYDPEGKLQPGGKVFDMPSASHPLRAAPVVRTPVKTGEATLKLTLKQLWGDKGEGWVCLKAPGKSAAIVGEYKWTEKPSGPVQLSFDVSDEVAGDGTYLVGVRHVRGWYYALTAAEIVRGGKSVAKWTGEEKVRWTFQPPLLAALEVGANPNGNGRRGTSPRPTDGHGDGHVLLPAACDWATGALELDPSETGQPALMSGDGSAEWWLNVPRDTNYRVHLRYAAAAPRPCDIVIDGEDLNAYDMCALNVTGRSTARDAFWEYQGSVRLKAGTHWVRVQDVLPDVVALWLEPTAKLPGGKVPWRAFRAANALQSQEDYGEIMTLGTADGGVALRGKAEWWQVQPQFGAASGQVTLDKDHNPQFSASFANTDPAQLFAGDRVRFRCPLAWNLEPYSSMRFTLQGAGSQHAIALSVVDAKGDEKLLWRGRDLSDQPVAVDAPLSFEGNDVFDGQRIVAFCVDLDEGNVSPEQANRVQATLRDLRVIRRDALVSGSEGGARWEQARKAIAAFLQPGKPSAAVKSPGFRPWTRPVVPETHPLYATTEPKPVTRATLGYNLEFTGARDVSARALQMFHTDYDFGRINWPHIGILPQRRDFRNDEDYQAALKHLEERVTEVKRRGLWLFDIWGYVPFGEAGPTPQVKPEHHEILTRVLGDRFLGYDNGEQDGRYIGGYSDRGSFTDRRGGWADFVKWDTGICDDSLNYMNATGSLNFSHYYGERGARMLGLETAQGLPSDTLMFAFLRGAGKQYGRLIYQATSIWNRYGYNMYHERKTDGGAGYGFGPHKGCSLSLHKRLFFQSYTGGDSICGSETSQFTGDQLPGGKAELSPLGKQHLAIKQWVDKHPDRGVMYTPVAFMLGFYHGWNMPRHLYRGDKYKIWGKLPYEKGDYAVDQFFRMVWPGYEDASYLRNERGFVTPTPYGDLFDVITNRCHPDILKQYTSLVLLGDVELTAEVAGNLAGFVKQGGDVWLAVGNAKQLPAALTGLQYGDPAQAVMTAPATGKDGPTMEQPYTYTVAQLQTAQALLVNEAGHPVLTLNTVGKGRVFVCLADQYLTGKLTYANPKLLNMEPPYRLLRGVQRVLDTYFRSFSPVKVYPEGLNVRVNCYAGDPKRLLVSLTNNELFADWAGEVHLAQGSVAKAADLRGNARLQAGKVLKATVPAGDVAIIEVRLR